MLFNLIIATLVAIILAKELQTLWLIGFVPDQVLLTLLRLCGEAGIVVVILLITRRKPSDIS